MLSSRRQQHCILASQNTPLALVKQIALRYLNKLLKSNAGKMQVHHTLHDLKDLCNHHLNQSERAIKTFKSSFDETYDIGSNTADAKCLLVAKTTPTIRLSQQMILSTSHPLNLIANCTQPQHASIRQQQQTANGHPTLKRRRRKGFTTTPTSQGRQISQGSGGGSFC